MPTGDQMWLLACRRSGRSWLSRFLATARFLLRAFSQRHRPSYNYLQVTYLYIFSDAILSSANNLYTETRVPYLSRLRLQEAESLGFKCFRFCAKFFVFLI
jgi:hypothetical protein